MWFLHIRNKEIKSLTVGCQSFPWLDLDSGPRLIGVATAQRALISQITENSCGVFSINGAFKRSIPKHSRLKHTLNFYMHNNIHTTFFGPYRIPDAKRSAILIASFRPTLLSFSDPAPTLCKYSECTGGHLCAHGRVGLNMRCDQVLYWRIAMLRQQKAIPPLTNKKPRLKSGVKQLRRIPLSQSGPPWVASESNTVFIIYQYSLSYLV